MKNQSRSLTLRHLIKSSLQFDPHPMHRRVHFNSFRKSIDVVEDKLKLSKKRNKEIDPPLVGSGTPVASSMTRFRADTICKQTIIKRHEKQQQRHDDTVAITAAATTNNHQDDDDEEATASATTNSNKSHGIA